MESSLASVLLKPREADRLAMGHPWVYRKAVSRVTRDVADGEVVQVKDHKHRFLGVGLYHSQSNLTVRLLSKERATIDSAFLEARIRDALRLRQRDLPEATAFRVVNAESDFLSGVIVDRYGGAVVLQTAAYGMDQRKDDLVKSLRHLLSPDCILERNDFTARQPEGLPETKQVLYGHYDGPIRVGINGLSFDADLWSGQKTGLYLDQQRNYARVAEWAVGRRVLDAFSFVGGFAIHAARAGAVEVTGIDQSETAIEQARQNAERNGLADRCRWVTGNVFDWLRDKAKRPAAHAYDMVILDPPSFTRTRHHVPEALRGYKEIHVRALKLLKPGGVLVTFCCSHHVGAPVFQQVILEAATDAGRSLRRLETYGPAPDHPVILNIPETEYLKGFAFEVTGY